MLRDYFSEDPAEERCGVCDNCWAETPVKTGKTDRLEGTEATKVPGDLLVVRFPGGRSRKLKREFARPVARSPQKR